MGAIHVKRLDDLVDESNEMARAIKMSDILKDLCRARVGVEFWTGNLEQGIGARVSGEEDALLNEEREIAICEATRMLLAYGGFLHALTFIVERSGMARPKEAWDVGSIGKAHSLMIAAVEEIAEQARRERVQERLTEFNKSMLAWCPAYTVIEDVPA